MKADSRFTLATRPPDAARAARYAMRKFHLKPLTVLIASGIFIQACNTLPPVTQPDDDSVVNTSQVQRTASSPRSYRQRTVVNAGTVVFAPDAPPLPSHADTVWYRVSNGLQFALDHHNEQIAEEVDWFHSNPRYVAEVTERATPFIYEIVQEVERRGLPLELALLPVIESAFNPMARSSQSAAGLWQFMAPTATSLGLKRDWWYDGRHDPMASTSAALDYLESLYAQFDEDWLLALAAYNAGQGNVQRAIRRNEQRGLDTDFWSLPLPRETRRHVPRLLGLAHVMADPDNFELALSATPDQPYLIAYDVGSQIDLGLVATLAELEPERIYELNPGYLQWATHPDGPHTVWLPVSSLPVFKNNLAALGDSRVTWDRYVIQPGDTLSGIASRFGTQVAVLQQTNSLTGSRIIAGDSLLIPRAYRAGEPLPSPSVVLADASDTANSSQALQYEVRPGDSLARIARTYDVSIEELTRWNQIGRGSLIHPGQELVLYLE